jgi:HlyD family secretion protein
MTDILAFFTGVLAAIIPGFGADEVRLYYGYAEAEYVYVAARSAGVIEDIAVGEGDSVSMGDPLFAQSTDQLEAQLRAAQARIEAAQANVLNLETGSRDAEIEVIRASLRKAESDLTLAEGNLERSRRLLDQGVVSPARVDQDQANRDAAEAQVAQLQAQLAVAELPARDAQVIAAEANLTAAQAEAEIVALQLDDRHIVAPVNGVVDRVFFEAGEMAGTGSPVVSLLPPDQIKIRFFIPETERAGFPIGTPLTISCDGCPQSYDAELSYLASDPQHTPPVIYSRDERSRLVFMAEARFVTDPALAPGEPVTIARALP